jgi:hypothetical protein
MGKYVNELMDEQVVILRKRRRNVQNISYFATPVAIRVIALSDPTRSEHDIPGAETEKEFCHRAPWRRRERSVKFAS